MHLPADINLHIPLQYQNINFFFKVGVPPLTEIRFYSNCCRPVHAPERLALAMLKHEVEVMALSLAGDDIH